MMKTENNTNSVFGKIRERLVLIKDLAASTPHCRWIIGLSLAGGIFTFFGFPLFIPVLDYLRGGVSPENSRILASMEWVIRSVGFQPDFTSMLMLAAVLILLGELIVNLNSLIALYASYDLIKDYSKRMFEMYLKVNWLWLIGTNSGELNYVILKEAELAAACHLNAQRLIISGIQCLVYFYLAIYLSPMCVMIAVVLYGILMLVNLKNAHAIQRINLRNNEIFKKMSSLFNGIQQNKKFLKTSLLNRSVIDRTIFNLENMRKNHQSTGLRLQLQQGWNFVTLFIFLIGLILFHDRIGMDYSALLVLILVFNRLSPQFNFFSATYSALNNYLPMYFSIQQRLGDMERNMEESGHKIYDGNGAIRFEHVHFSYPNGTEVFKDVSLTIAPFKTSAIVGSSGSGKTTLLDLVLGLLKPDAGNIFYGDIRHDELDLNSLRSKIAYISQNPTLLDGTLRENLTIGCPEATEEMIWTICKKVHLDQTIASLPGGLETKVGENGIKLSGGQRQRVIIGRALFLNPKILILDEATSELDSETEKMLQQTIKDLSKELTIIIVAHRLSTVRLADTIYVLEQGVVCESGSYEQLLEQKGRFHLLDSLQRS